MNSKLIKIFIYSLKLINCYELNEWTKYKLKVDNENWKIEDYINIDFNIPDLTLKYWKDKIING